jgi:hypothetical protein
MAPVSKRPLEDRHYEYSPLDSKPKERFIQALPILSNNDEQLLRSSILDHQSEGITSL